MIIRLRSLGDCVLTTPAISLLHSYRPDLTIAVMAEQAFRPVFEGNPAVSLLPEPSVAEARAFRADLALNLHGLQASMELTVASRARWRAGFSHHRSSGVYNVQIPRAQEIFGEERPVHTAEHLASAMFYLGVPRSEIPRAQLFAPPPQESLPTAPAPFAVLHPFARTPDMTWPAERFARLAAHLRDRLLLPPVFVGLPANDFTPFRDFSCLVGGPITGITRLMSRAALFIGNDSGPAHVAAAFGVPVLVLFGPSDDYMAWRPWRTEHEFLKGDSTCESIPYEAALGALARLKARTLTSPTLKWPPSLAAGALRRMI
ncbi:MAG TPA: glycosyltransferase family 9 protein [Candidatus Acidoferrum sp.]|nr:glycosyltransferase family 9 protein [Candidatus Acidoferrum sp.]